MLRPRAVLALSVLFAAACASSWRGSIGAILAQDKRTHVVVVRDAPEGMGAARAGILPGDEILAIDGESARDLAPAGIHAKLEGEVGTKVRLVVRRGTDVREVIVERGPFREAK